MAEYGYTYQTFSTYNTVRGEARQPVMKPFVPFVPNTSNSNSESTRKIVVPVASRSYGDDYSKHSSPAEAYPTGGDDYNRHSSTTSPVRGSPRKADEFLTKVHNEASRPARLTPVPATDWRHSTQPTTYNGVNGYGDYANNKEGRKPIGSTVKNDNRDGYNGTRNGHGDYGIHDNKEERKPIGSTIRNDNYAYNGPNGYADYGNKEGRKPIGNTLRNDNYDGTNGYGDYSSNKPVGGTIRNDNHDGYNGANDYGDYGSNKEGRNPIGGTIRTDNNHDGYNGPNDYGDYGNKEGRKPIGNPIRNDNYDGYYGPNGYVNGGNNDYGNYNNKEGPRPFDGYNGDNGYGNYKNKEGRSPTGSGGDWSRPKITPSWTAAPRKGTQLSEPTHDIAKAIEMLAKVTGTALPYDHNQQRNGVGEAAAASKFEKGTELAKEAERLKNIVTGPAHSRSSVPVLEAPTPHKDDIYTRDAPKRDDARRHGSTINSWEAEKKFKGKRV